MHNFILFQVIGGSPGLTPDIAETLLSFQKCILCISHFSGFTAVHKPIQLVNIIECSNEKHVSAISCICMYIYIY